MERIDKIIASSLNISRNDAKALIKSGRAEVDGVTVKDSSRRFDESGHSFSCDGQALHYSRFVYIMMNKPKGVISASDGKKEKTVIDILPTEMKRKKLFPAGRLDKDTTGFMLITDDGDFAHRILSPKNHIAKTYTAILDKPIDDTVIDAFSNGVLLNDTKCMPASLKSLDGSKKTVEVVIGQGMYHQIKRMFLKFGITVLELKRIKMGGLFLDDKLACGQCRYLSDDEIKMIENGE